MPKADSFTIEHEGRVTVRHTSPAARHRRFAGEEDRALALGGDGGYAMALTAMMIIPIMIFLALSVDLGAWYAQGSRQQRAADAASMAGVVWLPDSIKAAQEATRIAKANGYTTGVTPSTVAGNPTQYKVTIVQPAPRYFSKVFQSSAFNMSRNATAAFNKPIPMGSPTNKMGNDIDPTLCPGSQPVNSGSCAPQPLLWTAANAPYASFADGDPYSTRCPRGGSTGSGCDSSGVNPLYRSAGYEYAVDVGQGDVGVPLTIQGYDLVSLPRGSNNGGVPSNYARYMTINLTSGSSIFTVAAGGPLNAGTIPGDVGTRVVAITGGGLPANATVASRTSASQGNLSGNATATGTIIVRLGGGTGGTTYDCNTAKTPWNVGPAPTTQNCQTGDSDTGQNMDIQLYENDGSDLTIDVSTQLSCHWSLLSTDANTTNGRINLMNKWTNVCTFTPTKKGIYPLFVRNSGFQTTPGRGGFNPADTTGTGINAYALKVTGGATTRLYSLEDMSIWTNTASSNARFYLAEILPEHKGKTLNIDLYDPGDGSGPDDYIMQVQGPQAGAPATVPTAGTVIPAANVATSCQANLSVSATKGGGALSTANNCAVKTHTGGSSNGIYNNGWLRVQVKISPTYDCGPLVPTRPDCWWTIQYNFGAGLPTDRTVWSIAVVGDPVHLVN